MRAACASASRRPPPRAKTRRTAQAAGVTFEQRAVYKSSFSPDIGWLRQLELVLWMGDQEELQRLAPSASSEDVETAGCDGDGAVTIDACLNAIGIGPVQW